VIRRYQETYTFKFDEEIPNLITEYLPQIYQPKRVFKFFKRYFLFLYLRQNKYELNSISAEVKKVLWINVSATSLGDTIMDLSSRQMLTGIELDLLTKGHNSELYRHDDFFKSIFTDAKKITKEYDLIILDSYSSRTLRLKYQVSKTTRFVSMFGFFNGPEINRTLFSFHKMNYLLNNKFDTSYINSNARPFISTKAGPSWKEIKKDIACPYISIVIGGEWRYRTYGYWEEVIKKFSDTFPDIFICLIGSNNGQKLSKQITLNLKGRKIINLVNKTSFIEAAMIASKSKVLLCCDGGLMHAANALGGKSLVLFSRVLPELRLTLSSNAISIYDKEDVSNIKPEAIFSELKEIITPSGKYHQIE